MSATLPWLALGICHFKKHWKETWIPSPGLQKEHMAVRGCQGWFSCWPYSWWTVLCIALPEPIGVQLWFMLQALPVTFLSLSWSLGAPPLILSYTFSSGSGTPWNYSLSLVIMSSLKILKWSLNLYSLCSFVHAICFVHAGESPFPIAPL
jgi:hypothetical protein